MNYIYRESSNVFTIFFVEKVLIYNLSKIVCRNIAVKKTKNYF